LLACKAYDLDAAITDFAPALVGDGAVLPVLNRIEVRIGCLEQCLAAFTN
jgi:hypothetical protein